MIFKKRSGRGWTASVLGKRLSMLSLCGLLVFGLVSLPVRREVEATPVPAAMLPDFSTLAEKASPSIVNISTTTHPKRDRNMPYADQLPELLRRYFGLEIPDLPNHGGAPPRPRPRSLGSGFIISADGYVLTNNHVIEGADEIVVRMNDRSEYKAKLVGADSKSDLALLKVDVKGAGLPAVTVGSSEVLKPGQWVFAIGSPFGFDYSVTKGIISALNRTLPTESYVPFIQTDVPINPGNSGGPLLNMKGQVIGINSQIYTRSGGFMGLSFAIPIDDAMDVVRQLKTSGQVVRGWLGVLVQDVDRNLAESFGLKKPHGALLSQVLSNGPAAKAGLQAGDIIIRFNGRDIKFSADLPVAVGRAPVGKKVNVVFVREGKERTLAVVPGELSEDTPRQAPGQPRSDEVLGLSITDLTDEIRASLKQEGVEGVEGVVVEHEGRGLLRRDLITHVLHNQRQLPVRNVKEFKQVVAELPKRQSVTIRVIRKGAARFIPISPLD
ncbi:MAG: DegQ family serine endoprotease [Kistimonas sp.]|nr:DegQ family serine endoprotease [Kistimonas sp.]